MTRYHLIREIYQKIPNSDRGINKSGFHVVSLCEQRIPMYATLEKLSSQKLNRLATRLGIPIGLNEIH